MRTFLVTFKQEVVCQIYVEVEAESEEKALQLVESGEFIARSEWLEGEEITDMRDFQIVETEE